MAIKLNNAVPGKGNIRAKIRLLYNILFEGILSHRYSNGLKFILHDTAYEGRNQKTPSRQEYSVVADMVFAPKYRGKILTGDVRNDH
ncbi:MAG: hypothetical protein SCH70_13370 [Candidatus Methanoperedens sp.]|nr:hypothetical protein [Candidatus Methanoperedens sp.]